MSVGDAQREARGPSTVEVMCAYASASRAAVRGAPDGTLSLWIDGAPPVTLATAASNARAALISPYRCERRHGDLRELCEVLPDRAAIVVSWSGEEEGGLARAMDVLVSTAGRVAVASLDERTLVLRAGAAAALCIASDRPVEWRIAAHDHGCSVRVHLVPPLRLAFGACDGDGRPARGVAPVLREPRVAGRMVDAELARVRGTGLELRLGRPVIPRALDWARILSRVTGPNPPAAHRHHMVLGLLVTGDFEGAVRCLGAPPTERLDDAAAFALAHARYQAWTGRTGPLLEHRGAVVRALRRIAAADPGRPDGAPAGGDPSGSARAVLGTALREGAVLAESLAGEADLAKVLASRARRSPGTESFLPTATDRQSTEDRITCARDSFVRGQLTGAGEALEQGASALLADVAAGVLEPRTAAMFCGAVVDGLLGAEPDAGRDRLTLRPRLAPPYLPAGVRRLRVGEAAFDLEVGMDAERYVLRVEQTDGAVPLQLVLEPWIPAGVWRAVRIDGRPAALAARPVDGGWAMPVQLVPDRARVMEVDLDANAGPP